MLDFGSDDDGIVARLHAALDRWERWRDDPPRWLRLGAALTLALVVAAVGWRALRPPAPPVDVAATIPIIGLDVTTTSAPPRPVIVHVVGEVLRPGVYELTAADRIADALDAAGGPTDSAAVGSLNLAAPLVDGSQIRVDHVDDIAGVVMPGPATTLGPSPGTEKGGAAAVVDLNRASAAELETLPGVGPATASKIVEHRDRSGPFRSVDDLLAVPGIGPAKLEAVRDRVVVS